MKEHKTPREIRPEIDDIIGFAAWYDNLYHNRPIEQRYRESSSDQPFIGRVTSAAGAWSQHLGIVARTYPSHSNGWCTTWIGWSWNLGISPDSTQLYQHRFRNLRSRTTLSRPCR